MSTYSTSLQGLKPASDGSFGLPELIEFIAQQYSDMPAANWAERLLDIIGQTDAMKPVTELGQPTRYNYDDLVMYFGQVRQTAEQVYVNWESSPLHIIIGMLEDSLPTTVAA